MYKETRGLVNSTVRHLEMGTETQKAPPIIHSARTILSAINDDSVTFTGRINLFVGNADNLEKLGEMPLLAICENYCSPDEIFLFFCDNEWEPQGTAVLDSVEEAKAKAEIGYKGISKKWVNSEATNEELDKYLREVCEVDPKSEWWKVECAFCGKDDSEATNMLGRNNIYICGECITSFYEILQEGENAYQVI